MAMTPKPETYPESYYAGAYWGPREETPEGCAQRTADFLCRLAVCDPALAHWYKPAKSRKDTRKHPLMPPNLPTLTEAFRHGVNREDKGEAIKELGFRFSFDNGGGRGDCASLRINGGMSAEGVTNHCVLNLPWRGLSADRVLTTPVLTDVVRAMALSWEPDWAVAMSLAHRDMDDEHGKASMWLGWVTYFSRQLGQVPPLPTPVSIEMVEDRGTLVVLTPERFTVANPEHLALARRVRELLARAGLLQPAVT